VKEVGGTVSITRQLWKIKLPRVRKKKQQKTKRAKREVGVESGGATPQKSTTTKEKNISPKQDGHGHRLEQKGRKNGKDKGKKENPNAGDK